MAIAEDPEMAAAVGANTTVAAVIAFALGGMLAGIAGVLIGPLTFANPYLGDTYGINGFVALMIGGAERPVGAMVGGLLLGVLTEAANHYIDSQAADWFPFVVVAVVLLLTPQGLFSFGAAAETVRGCTAVAVEGADRERRRRRPPRARRRPARAGAGGWRCGRAPELIVA